MSKDADDPIIRTSISLRASLWKEIEEYRPYTSSDLATKLGQELGKYGVDQQTLANILASLKV